MSDTILIRHEAPKGFQFISEEEYEKFQAWKQAQRGIRTWKLKIWPSINTELNQPNEPHDI